MRGLLALLVGLLAAGGAAAQVPGYVDLGRLVSSRAHGYGYGYAPTIVQEGGLYHMLFCTVGKPPIWDYVRYAVSADGVSWSAPTTVLVGTDEVGERAACDPSLVRYRAPADERPYWYLFYSGNARDVQTTMFVARADAIGGPYAKWTRRGTWEVDAPDPQTIIGPTRPKADGTQFYGAGQQSVVVERDRLVAWYSDDTTCGATSCLRIFRTVTRDPTRWPRGTATNVTTPSIDVKRDPAGGYVMIGIEDQHEAGAALSLRRSRDGTTWTAPRIVCGPGCFPAFTHNAGIAGDLYGRLLPEALLVVYGGPRDRDPACGKCWAQWDLFGGRLALPAR